MNHLENEKSPYLIQHRENPVDWYPWSPEAFERAKKENKPIFLSVGYSTCHWCHVMAHESFMDTEIAKYMNATFINIKVDREERPDIDQIYMSVCQMITGSGGWPLNIIMTHDKKPFFAATYIPKRGRNGKMGMFELIDVIRQLWVQDSDEHLKVAEQILKELNQPANDKTKMDNADYISADLFKLAVDVFQSNFDETNGGFGKRPKFPGGHNLIYLLRYAFRNPKQSRALSMVEKTLTNMRKGGIFDQIGYGFHRYSTDEKWFLPHFEKMLYDQAILSLTFSDAWKITKNESFRITVENILDFVRKELTDEDGGFYSALDADSEGEEGKFYTWDYDEIKNNLTKEEWSHFNEVYSILPQGNFKDEATGQSNGKNIIFIPAKDNLSSESKKLHHIQKLNQKLFAIRASRVRPNTDDKILTNWNGLMIAAMADGYGISKKPEYLEAALHAANFIDRTLLNKNIAWHRYRDNESGISANLEDFAFYIFGILKLYSATHDVQYLKKSQDLCQIMIDMFYDKENGGFFLSSSESFHREKLIVRYKDYYDGALPCGNSFAIYALILLRKFTGNDHWSKTIEECIRSYAPYAMSYPSGVTFFLQAVDLYHNPGSEVVINGNSDNDEIKKSIEFIQSNYLPGMTFHQRNVENFKELARIAPFTESMGDPKITSFYVCQNYSCQQPVYKYNDFLNLISGPIGAA